ncbi:PRC-barrel domain-containing protein [Marinobacter sp.]|uniref:PRC-barrel domain-containing protein n=1 Tax=Marinobacter sp. TaxID=50741 RepID=UPI00384E071E
MDEKSSDRILTHTGCVAAFCACLLAGSMAVSAAEGLYSADDLLAAGVYDTEGEQIGDVDDLLLGPAMSVHSLIIRTGAVLGMGGRRLVAERGTFTVKVNAERTKFDDVEYQVQLGISREMLKNLPEYNEGWWDQTRQGLSEAWEQTRKTTRNAWESTVEATSSAWRSLQKKADEIREQQN